ncbi:MAG TPA: sigma-54 dependent transcriptional regulator [Acidobacteriota bacterium]|jgi:DNA-binding NtrC family response regulator
MKHSVLVLEDDRALASALRDFLDEEGWEVETAGTVGEARTKVADKVFDLVLADYLLPDEHGLSIFEEIQHRSPLTKVMMMTGVKDMEVAAEAFKKGAADLISKPFKIAELEERIGRLMVAKRNQVKAEIQTSARRPFLEPHNMVGQGPAIQIVFRLIDMVADTNATVLITGESGTGKELVARAIHDSSPRRKNSFVALNCGAIPENLLEDELFGHVRGAYTDARGSRIGRFEQANGGTLFLDEIGNMPLSLQVKLLRVLEEKQFEKLGSDETVKVDVRIVTATNSELREKVKRGEFRDDLFYRLHVVPIHLPPLRERPEDIPLLATHFLQLFSQEHGLPPKQLDTGAIKHLKQYDWPGNIRELRNVLELAFVTSRDRTILEVGDFPTLRAVKIAGVEEKPLLQNYMRLPEGGIDLNQVVAELEKSLICQSLERTGGNKGQAARLLSLKRTTLVEKLRRLNLLKENGSKPEESQ